MAKEPAPSERRLPIIDVGPRVSSRLPSGRLRIELLTDPWSVWCWGFEPIRRTLALRHPDLEFRFLLGGMFEEMPRPEQLGFDVERFFSIVHHTTGMPIAFDAARRDRPTSTYPACVHVHTVRLLAPEREEAYLRALREAAYLDGLNISKDEVGASVAERIGVSSAAFLKERRSGRPEAAFRARIENLQRRDLHGYPTILFTVDDKTHVVQGFQSLPAVLGIAQSLTGRLSAPAPDPELTKIILPGERVATREIAQVLGVSVEKAFEICAVAEQRKVLRREGHSGGIVWSLAGPKMQPVASSRNRRAPLITPAP